ncbi:golgin subfamily A member 6-like protein 25 [Planococcus citri]|uniref:golgin subfamily A member 6-like protein 25 n=1 Tax=Planococcus citri TaxID=170843 RepID=UPI0031F88491
MHSKSNLHFIIFMALLSISVHGFHVDDSDKHSISESIRYIALPKNASETLSESFVELIKQIMDVQVQLAIKMREMEKRDIELSVKEKEAEKQKDEIKKLEDLCKQKEEYINKTAAVLKNKEEKIKLRETQVQKNEQSVDQAEKEIKIKMKLVKEQDEQVQQREESINSTHIEIINQQQRLKTLEEEFKRTEAAIKLQKVEIAKQVELVELKEESVNKTKLLTKFKEALLEQQEETLQKKEIELSAEKERVKKHEEEQMEQMKQKEVSIEKAETDIKIREEILQKREEKLKQKEKSNCSVSWVPASDGGVPENAIVGGQEGTETLYVGRANHSGSLIPGKIQPNLHCSEFMYKDYEVAVLDNQNVCSISWVPARNGNFPQNAILGGHNDQGENLYVGRAMVKDSVWVPGKLLPKHKSLCVPFNRQESCHTEYHVAVINELIQ